MPTRPHPDDGLGLDPPFAVGSRDTELPQGLPRVARASARRLLEETDRAGTAVAAQLDRDTAAWGDIAGWVYRFTAAQMRSRYDIGDIAQDVLLKLCASRTFDPRSEPRLRNSYIWKTVASAIRDGHRRERRRRVDLAGDLAEAFVDGLACPLDERVRDVVTLVPLVDWFVERVGMPPAPSRVFRAMYYTGLGPKDLAPLLDMKPNTVSANARRAELKIMEAAGLSEAEFQTVRWSRAQSAATLRALAEPDRTTLLRALTKVRTLVEEFSREGVVGNGR
jgi:RNA polymerase sigma factor (sigma-70 family)